MLYFFGWVVLIVATILAVVVGAVIEKKRQNSLPQSFVMEAAEVELTEEGTPEAEGEDDLTRRLRRLRLISDGMTQEEMYAHAQATLELATMLLEKNQIPEAGEALDILVRQPGIGEEYLIRSLTKHAMVFSQLGDSDRVNESLSNLQEVVARHPAALDNVRRNLPLEEMELLSKVV